MPEISEADNELLLLAKKTLSGKNRMEQLRLMKKEVPDASFAELEFDDRITSALAPIQEENRKLREEIDRREAIQNVQAQRVALKAKKGLSDEDLIAVEKIMVDRKIGDHETAADFYKMNSKISTPARPSWDRSATVPAHEGLKVDPKKWALAEAAKVLDEFQGIRH